MIACAGLCGAALTPHLAFAQPNAPTQQIATAESIDINSEVLVAMLSGRFRLADDISAAPLNGSLCVDVQQVFGALDFPIIVDRSRQLATGWFINENQNFSLDLNTGAAQVGTKRISISPNAIGKLSTGSCVTIEALAPLLGLSIEYQATGGFLGVTSVQPLPLIERLTRQDRTSANSEDTGNPSAPPRLRSLPYRAFVAPNVDVGVTFNRAQAPGTSSKIGASWGVLSVGELAYMTAEGQLGGNEKGLNGEISRFRLYRSEAEGGVFGFARLTEFSVGDISAIGSSLGAAGGVGLGFSVSTFPLSRPTSFDRTSFQGDLPAGWDVELYRNGQLLEFKNDGTTGGYSFRDIPVLFGDNNFEIVLYGPQGQRRVINRRVNASNFLAPKGDSYYRAAIYRPEVLFGKVKDGSGVRIDLRAVIGLGANFNVGGGFDSYMLADRRLSVGTISALTSVSGVAINTELSVTSDGKVAGQLEAQGQGKGASIRGRLILAQNGFETERLAKNIIARFDTSADRSFRLSSRSSGALTGRFIYDRYSDGEYTFTARQRMTLSYGNSSLAQSLTWSHSSSGQRRDQIEGEIGYSLRRGLMSVRASTEYSIHPTAKINRLSVAAERSLGVNSTSWRWRGETSWEAENRKFIHSIGVGREFRLLNFDFVAETDGRSNHSIGLTLSFSLGRRNNGWGMTSRPLATGGTVRARIFEDNDDDGKFSAGDIPVARAGVIGNSGRQSSMTDTNGYAVIDSVAPNAPTLVTVLTDDLADTNMYGRPTYTKAREGTVSEIAIPLTLMGSIEGTVAMVAGFDPTANPLGGVALVLLNSQQKEIARTTSAYDGYYSFDLVPVGAYTVALASDTSLARRFRPVMPTQVVTTRTSPGAQASSMTLIETNPTSTRMALRGLL
jgi:hypothetical protein